jgi:hypothetical protein
MKSPISDSFNTNTILVEVLNSIQVAKNNAIEFDRKSVVTRTPGLHQGQIWMSDDFIYDSFSKQFVFCPCNILLLLTLLCRRLSR